MIQIVSENFISKIFNIHFPISKCSIDFICDQREKKEKF